VQNLIERRKSKQNPVPLPAIDHRNLFKAPRDQGQCGSCWAFSTAAAVEAHTKKTGGSNDYLSTQQLINCNSKSFGCGGGTFPSALEYISKNGLVKDSRITYTKNNGTCDQTLTTQPDAKIDSYDSCEGDCTEEKIIEFLKQGPVLIGVSGENDSFRSFGDGIYTAACSDKLNHAVVLVGCGKDNDSNKEYWLVRNSWGTDWGDRGYIKIARDKKNNNSCFVTKMAYLPKIGGGSNAGSSPSSGSGGSGGAGVAANSAGVGVNANANTKASDMPPGKKIRKAKKKLFKKSKKRMSKK